MTRAQMLDIAVRRTTSADMRRALDAAFIVHFPLTLEIIRAEFHRVADEQRWLARVRDRHDDLRHHRAVLMVCDDDAARFVRPAQ